jgi:outer membrane protein OmpA-like peptidoglycan-associated protein
MKGPRPRGVLARVALVVSLAVAAFEAPAHAEPTTTGFALNTYRPAEAGSDWFANESLDLRGGARPAISLVADIAYRPLVLFGPDGQELVALVDGQLFYHVGASLVVGRRLRLAASLPLLIYSQGGQGVLAELGDQRNVALSSSDGSGIGDARIAADLRLLGEYGGPFSLALGARLFAATGSERQFTSDGRARLEGRVMWAGQAGWFTYAAHTGVMLHGERDDFAAIPFGTDLTFGVGLGAQLARGRLHVGPELYGHTVISDDGEGFLETPSTPVEVALGGKLAIADTLGLGLAVARGLTAGIGASELRVMAAFDWVAAVESAPPNDAPLPATRDLDGDSVTDEWDACPSVAGPARPLDRARSGCPDPADGDGDGITDEVDACPVESGVPSGDPARHGCPPSDRDRDGVADTIDACPDTAGIRLADALRSGCPADSDGDGINDTADACPADAGPRSRDPEQTGCPRARIERGGIQLTEPVKFATAAASILPESSPLLDAVAELLVAHPEIELCSVEGYADDTGSAALDAKLSRDRALAVVMRLVDNGVSARRLTAKGHGSSPPTDDNGGAERRRGARGVEFRIVRVRAEGRPRLESK